jgi:hypothetical protein
MNNKLRIGDKIRWNVSIGSGTVYTIIDIDTNREPRMASGYEFHDQILFEWEDYFGCKCTDWGHSYDELNKLLNKGGLIIVSRSIEPIRELKKFKL